MGWFDNSEYQAIGRRLDKIDKDLTALKLQLTAQGKNNMATKAEVKADLDELKQIVTDTRGAANSAIALIKKLLDQVTNAAASAADLDELRTDLAVIKTETLAEEDDLKKAIEANPGPTPTP